MAAALPCASATSLFAKSPVESGKSATRRLFLFLDWFHVQKGELKVTLDPQRVSTEGKKLLETYEHDFSKKFEQSSHGFKSDAPFGIRITQETAEHSETLARRRPAVGEKRFNVPPCSSTKAATAAGTSPG